MDPRRNRPSPGNVYLVQSLGVSNGIPTATLINGMGDVYTVPVATLGGGKGALIYAPTRAGSRQIAMRGEGIIPQAHMVGGSAHADNAHELFDAEREAPAAAEPFPERVGAEDLLLYNNTSRIIIGEGGEIVLDTPFCNPLRLQLGDNGYLQVTCQDEATERAALGRATVDAIADVVAKVNSVGQQLAALVAAIQGSVPATGPEPGYAVAKAAALLLDSVYTPLEEPGDELLAAALRISPKTEADRLAASIEG